MKKALITGITGQDGSYLTDLLLEKAYEVHGIVRRSSSFNRWRIEHLIQDPAIYGKQLFLHYADLSDDASLRRIFSRTKPYEFYHLAGQSHVGISFEIPEVTTQEIANCTLKLLEICRDQTMKHPDLHYDLAAPKRAPEGIVESPLEWRRQVCWQHIERKSREDVRRSSEEESPKGTAGVL